MVFRWWRLDEPSYSNFVCLSVSTHIDLNKLTPLSLYVPPPFPLGALSPDNWIMYHGLIIVFVFKCWRCIWSQLNPRGGAIKLWVLHETYETIRWFFDIQNAFLHYCNMPLVYVVAGNMLFFIQHAFVSHSVNLRTETRVLFFEEPFFCDNSLYQFILSQFESKSFFILSFAQFWLPAFIISKTQCTHIVRTLQNPRDTDIGIETF